MWRYVIIGSAFIMVLLFFQQLDFVADNDHPIIDTSLKITTQLSPEPRIDSLIEIADTCLAIGATNKALVVLGKAVDASGASTAAEEEALLRGIRFQVTTARASQTKPELSEQLRQAEKLDVPNPPSIDIVDAFAWLGLGFHLRSEAPASLQVFTRALSRADQLAAARVDRHRDESYLLMYRLATQAEQSELAQTARDKIQDPYYACQAWMSEDLEHAQGLLAQMPPADQLVAARLIARERALQAPFGGNSPELEDLYVEAAMALHRGKDARTVLATALGKATRIPHPQERVKFLNHCARIFHTMNMQLNGPFMQALRTSTAFNEPFYVKHQVQTLSSIEVTLTLNPQKDRPASVIDRAFTRMCADEISAFILERSVEASPKGAWDLRYLIAVPDLTTGEKLVRHTLEAADAPEAGLTTKE